jgi:hypothetical protein
MTSRPMARYDELCGSLGVVIGADVNAILYLFSIRDSLFTGYAGWCNHNL